MIVKLKPGASLDDKIAEYEARDDVIIAEENGTMETSDDPTFTSQASQGTGTGATAQGSSLPNDQYLSRQWDLTAIHALEAWNLYSGNFNAQDGAPIAIVDSGVAASSGPPTRARA